MLVLVGLGVVTASVFAGFMIAGGPMLVLIQPAEFLIIGGAAVGVRLAGTPMSVVKQLVGQLIAAMKPSPFSRAVYLDLLQLLYEVLVKAKKSGLIALEKDLATPQESPLFSAHPGFLHHHEAVQFTCESLSMLVDGSISPDDFDQVLDSHIETHHDEAVKPAGTLAKVADALPALGIVAAVLGIVITMQHVDGKPAEIGHHVAVALELSSDRANSARRVLEAAGLPEGRIDRVIGHADRIPMVPGDPLDAMNRRISIIVRRVEP